VFYGAKHTLITAIFRRKVRVEYGALLWRLKTVLIVAMYLEFFNKFVANQSHSNENRAQVGFRSEISQNFRHSLVRNTLID
jgi:hypothetical protein